jgi:hypothetical protein
LELWRIIARGFEVVWNEQMNNPTMKLDILVDGVKKALVRQKPAKFHDSVKTFHMRAMV